LADSEDHLAMFYEEVHIAGAHAVMRIIAS